ncbi:hypothetical protein TpMuguga_04g02050 [Theileria parva strain Muguga]|uniref:uncharacterized protein n=1 Tax=Theileria parva strain Muguga TaxID=333668 RepID=UPI001C61CEFE|nr:uncharacterized protein TpMuguga_04g02050 [Theileria parva strain Muguga]KAF5153234.1 hypothetical protein TpMuguga_04g02050 [Theileria parva strain Muguga]
MIPQLYKLCRISNKVYRISNKVYRISNKVFRSKFQGSTSFVYFNLIKLQNQLSHFPVAHYGTFLHRFNSPNLFPTVSLATGICNTNSLSNSTKCISTLKRRKFKIKKHKKKKRKKRWSRMSLIPWRPAQDLKQTYQSPAKIRRIVKERRRRNKGNRTLRIPRQR